MSRRRVVAAGLGAALAISLAGCDLRPREEAPPVAAVPDPTAPNNTAANPGPDGPPVAPKQRVAQALNCPDGAPTRLLVERAGQRVMDIPTAELDKVRGSSKPDEGKFKGRLLVPVSVLGAKRLQVVPCMGDPVEIASSDRIALTPNKRGNLKLVSLDGDGAPLVKDIALLRIVE